MAFKPGFCPRPSKPGHMAIYPEGVFSRKVGSKFRFDWSETEVSTEVEPLKPRFDRGKIAINQTYLSPILVTHHLNVSEHLSQPHTHRFPAAVTRQNTDQASSRPTAPGWD